MVKKTIMLGCMALTVLAAATSCGSGEDATEMPEVEAPVTFGDSLLTNLGAGEGISRLVGLNNLPEEVRKQLDKDKYLAGMKAILMADTSASFRQGMATALGYMEIIEQAKAAGIVADPAMFLANFARQFKAETADTAQLNKIREELNPQMMRAQDKIMMYQYEQQAKMQAQAEMLFRKNIEAGKEFMSKILAADKDVKTTESGMSYKILKQGNGPVAKNGSKVKVIYTGKLIDGTVFDSSEGQAVEFSTEGVVPGFAEALTTFPAGTHLTLYLPQDLAYGQQGAAVIEPGSTLVFDLEIVE